MKQTDFLGQVMRENSKGNAKSMLKSAPILWLLAVLTFFIVPTVIPTMPLITVAMTLIFLVLGVVLLIVGLFRLLIFKGGSFVLRSDNVTREDAHRIINEEAAQGSILLEEYFRPTSQSSSPKFILTPSFLLVTTGKAEVIPTSEITDINLEFKNDKTFGREVIYQVKTSRKTHPFKCFQADKMHGARVANELKNHILTRDNISS